MFVKRHKKAFITVLVILALVLTYPLWPSFARCQVVRVKLVATLQYQEMTHPADGKDYMSPDGSACYFENKLTLNALGKMALTSSVIDVTHVSMSPWPTPMYYVGDLQIGGYGNLVYHEKNASYVFYPKEDDRARLMDYVSQIMQRGEMNGLV